MLINHNNNEITHVKFVSYTGKWPNLCSGVLTLEIDGIAYHFGHEVGSYDITANKFKDNNCDSFWHSGGCVQADEDWNYNVLQGEWEIDADEIPEEFRKYAAEIDEVFNNNVPWGCCGGCI
jgi:hypothetical protein